MADVCLSGYESLASYDRREPDWEPPEFFEDVDDALEVARHWIADRHDARVEIVVVSDLVGRVVAVVARSTVEAVDGG